MLRHHRFLLWSFLCLALTAALWAGGHTLKKQEIAAKGTNFKYRLVYPQIENLTKPVIQEQINRMIKNIPEQLVTDFKTRLANRPKELNQPWSLSLDYQVKLDNGFCLSLIFRGDRFCSDAHPVPLLYTRNFRLITGEEMGWEDIFKPGGQALKLVSNYCRDYMKKHYDPKHMWIDKGAAPQAANYQYYVLTEKGLLVIFPRAQVAPSVDGEIEVTVPYEVLKTQMQSAKS